MMSGLLFGVLADEIHDDDLSPFDHAIASGIADWRGKLDGPMLAATRSGDFKWMALTCVLSTLALGVARKRRAAAFVATCGICTLALSTLLKWVFQRGRPGAEAGYLIDLPSSFSFPSGHAMASASVVGSLAVVAVVLLPKLWGRLAVAVATVFIFAVGASRVYFGVHYPSDVLGGQLASAALIAAATGWFYPRLLPGETRRLDR